MKFLDYGRQHPFGEIVGRPRHLAWPVNVYRVTLPGIAEGGDGLNPFERVVLKLIAECGPMDSKVLAHETCIPEDLVESILLRLMDKSMINEHNELVVQPGYLESINTNPDYQTALVFRETATGIMLPELQVLDDKNPLNKKESDEVFYPKRVPCEGFHKDKTPQPRDIIKLLRAAAKRSKAFRKDVRLPGVRQITIANDPEPYYLDCPIAIQKSDGEFRIANPFGNGYSLVLESSFSRLIEKHERLCDWLMDWKHGLSNPEQRKRPIKDIEPYDNDSNRNRYSMLVKNLQLGPYSKYRSMEKIYAAIEWALFYTCTQFPYDAVVNQLRISEQTEHPDILKKAAENVGLNPPENGFRFVPEGKLRDFLSGKAELATVLGIALLLATNDSSHPLHRMASKDKDFIIQLNRLRDERNSQGHGRGKKRSEEIELPEESFMREVVNSLLPSIVFSSTSLTQEDLDTAADMVLDARTSIQNEFGFVLFNRLGSNLQERVIHAEKFWLVCSEDKVYDALSLACDVYAAIQMAFRRRLSGVLPPEISDSEFITKAQQNAEESGLGPLPESISRVKTSAIRQTLQGNDQTLGACVIAFLIVTDSDTLHSVFDLNPAFLSDIERIVMQRGHGNQPLPLGKADILELRRSAFTAIKTLMEV